MSIDQKKLALIHIIKKELNLSEDEYRGILQQAAGVTSAKDLDEASFRKLMNFFVRSSHYQVNSYGLTLKQKFYLNYLCKRLGWGERHMSNFLNKYYHTPEINRLTKEQAIHAIESIKNISQHQFRGMHG